MNGISEWHLFLNPSEHRMPVGIATPGSKKSIEIMSASAVLNITELHNGQCCDPTADGCGMDDMEAWAVVE